MSGAGGIGRVVPADVLWGSLTIGQLGDDGIRSVDQSSGDGGE